MGHKIAEVIIEDGQLKHVDKKLPGGKIKAHLVYDIAEEGVSETEVMRIVKETAGIYKNIDVGAETRRLRESWERNVHK